MKMITSSGARRLYICGIVHFVRMETHFVTFTVCHYSLYVSSNIGISQKRWTYSISIEMWEWHTFWLEGVIYCAITKNKRNVHHFSIYSYVLRKLVWKRYVRCIVNFYSSSFRIQKIKRKTDNCEDITISWDEFVIKKEMDRESMNFYSHKGTEVEGFLLNNWVIGTFTSTVLVHYCLRQYKTLEKLKHLLTLTITRFN